MISLHRYRSVYEHRRLFRKTPLLGPPLSCAKHELLPSLLLVLLLLLLLVVLLLPLVLLLLLVIIIVLSLLPLSSSEMKAACGREGRLPQSDDQRGACGRQEGTGSVRFVSAP